MPDPNPLLKTAKWVISTMSHHGPDITAIDPRLTLIHTLRREGFEGQVAVSVYRHEEVGHIETEGADIVLEPFEDAADTTIKRVLESLSDR